MAGRNYHELEQAVAAATDQDVLKWETTLSGFRAVYRTGLGELTLQIRRDGTFEVMAGDRGHCCAHLLITPVVTEAVLRQKRKQSPIVDHKVEHLLEELERATTVLP
jgi:hypothetical protein